MKLCRFPLPMTASLAAPDGSAALTLEAHLADSGWTQTVRLWSDAHPEPLILSASGVTPGASAALLIHPWRAEFWIDGHLADEEWPDGELPLFRVPDARSGCG